jgi:hypothetical protein
MVLVSGTSQHNIPAGFLGRFSPDDGGRLRERAVWVLQSGEPHARVSTPERIGCEDNLYQLFGQWTLGQASLSVVDDVWAGYERRLSRALDGLSKLGQKTISANTWLRILVPFVTSLFVRGAEFGARFGIRMDRMGLTNFFSDPEHQSDNVNMARLFEFQRLLAPVMSARWVVMHTSSDHPVITNELGFTFSASQNGSKAVVIPIGPDAILAIVPTWPHGRVIMRDRGTGQWRALIEHVMLKPDEQRNFNRALANIAQGFLVGPTAASVKLHQQALDEDLPLNPEYLGSLWPCYRVLSEHQLEWYNMVSAISKKSSELTQPDLERRIPNEIAKDWKPVLIWPMNLDYVPTGLLLQDDAIALILPT